MKINNFSLVKKLGQLNQRDKQIVTYIIQQTLYSGKCISFYSVFTILQRFKDESIKLKMHGLTFLFYP